MFENGIILAAGKGSRMHPLTLRTPKPLLPQLENCLLLHQINFLRGNVKNLFVSVGYMADQVTKAALKFGADSVINVGDAGNSSWIRNSHLGDSNSQVIVLTCDNLMKLDLDILEMEAQEDTDKALIVPISRDSSYTGDRLTLNGDQILGMNPKQNSGLLATGMQILVPSKISTAQGEFCDFGEVWQHLIARECLYISQTRPDSWTAIDTPHDLSLWENGQEKNEI